MTCQKIASQILFSIYQSMVEVKKPMKFKIHQKVFIQSLGVYGFVSHYTGLRYLVTLDTGDQIRYEEGDIDAV